MYRYKLAFALALIALLGLANSLTPSEKFPGVFNFVNQTLFARDGTTTYSYQALPVRGGIFYTAAYPGANYGNMTALWGDTYGANPTRDDILIHTVGYGGGYIIDEQAGTITHYPGVATAPSLLGIAQVRTYIFTDNDNLLNLRVYAADGFLSGTLFWRRAYPLPTPAPCSFSLAVTSTGSWVSNNQRHERFSVSITNNGATQGISATLRVSTTDLQVESTSQVTPVSGSTTDYTANLYGLASGSSYSAAQFQFVGSGTKTISIVASQC